MNLIQAYEISYSFSSSKPFMNMLHVKVKIVSLLISESNLTQVSFIHITVNITNISDKYI